MKKGLNQLGKSQFRKRFYNRVYSKDLKRFKCVRRKTLKEKIQFVGLKLFSYVMLEVFARKPKNIVYMYDENGRFISISRYKHTGTLKNRLYGLARGFKS